MTTKEELKNSLLGERNAITGEGHIVDYDIAVTEFQEDGKMKTSEKIVFQIDIGGKQIGVDKIAYFDGKQKRKISGSWYGLQDDGTISPNTALGALLKYLNVGGIHATLMKKVTLIDDGNGFSALRAYQ